MRKRTVMRKSNIKKMAETEASYLAGLLDGEGHIYLYKLKKDNCYQPRVRIRITEQSLAEYAMKISGVGNVSSYIPNQTKLDGSPKRRVYEWGVTKITDVAKLLTQVAPYIIGKRDQAHLILKAVELKMQGIHDGKLMEDIITNIRKHYVK